MISNLNELHHAICMSLDRYADIIQPYAIAGNKVARKFLIIRFFLPKVECKQKIQTKLLWKTSSLTGIK